jgi:hypothetical protein
MKRSKFLTIASMIVSCLASSLQARTCVGNGDLVGAYGWTATRSLFSPVAITPPATTTTTLPASSTPLGAFLSGAAGTSAFASVGRISFDGSGNVLASNSATGAMNVKIGSYTVNTDCTVSISLSDTFATAGGITGNSDTKKVPLAIALEGIIVSNGNEVDAIQTGNTSAAVITLQRTTSFNACTNSSLNGAYGFLAVGVEAEPGGTTGGTIPTIAPFQLIGRFNADGAGNFVTDNLSQQSSSSVRRLVTGTYTVNTDCTGTAKLTDATGRSRNVNFVIANDSTSSTPNTSAQAPTVQLVFADTGVTGSGEARPQ